MFYEAELSFFRSTMKNLHLQTILTTADTVPFPVIDMGLRKLLCTEGYQKNIVLTARELEPNIVYTITDSFSCHYFALFLPDTFPTVIMFIGPYLNCEIDRPQIYELMEKYAIPPQFFPQIEKYYSSFPTFLDDSFLLALVNTFGEKIWGGLEHFTVKALENEFSEKIPPLTEETLASLQDAPGLSMQVLEDRYAAENRLMQAVSQGLSHKAELIVGNLPLSCLESRTSDPIRNLKNYAIIMNTLLRKAAENGSVHPLHIDRLSSDYARKIELINSKTSGLKLLREMIHKYCLLVKNHSMKGYSLLVQKVITQIDMDFTADLSLNSQARLLNVNPSYLSALFKKETGSTLTEYVNRKRIEHAILLLNSTTMQIQTIALSCGIPDVNYFTKTFKKFIGKTPREYREEITHFTQTRPGGVK